MAEEKSKKNNLSYFLYFVVVVAVLASILLYRAHKQLKMHPPSRPIQSSETNRLGAFFILSETRKATVGQ
jgi:hypothetical protein